MSVTLTGMSCDFCGKYLEADQPVLVMHCMCDNTLRLTIEQLEAIKSITFHQYIHYDNIEAHKVIKLITDFIDESKRGKKH